MGIPIKMWTDGDPSRNPENTTRFVLNGNLNVKKATLTPEEAFELVTQYDSKLNPVGFIDLPDGNLAILSTILDINFNQYYNEIGILTLDFYQPIIRDNPSVGVNFNFQTNHLIKGVSASKVNGDTVIYFVDGLNFDKYLNLNNPAIRRNADFQVLTPEDYKAMSLFTSNKDIELKDAKLIPGQLLSGVYYIGIEQVDSNFNPTKFISLSNPIPIANIQNNSVSTNSDGLPPGTVSGNGIQITVDKDVLGETYPYINIFVIYKQEQSFNAYIYKNIPFNSSSDFIYSITNLQNSEETSIDALLNNSEYTTSFTITQLDNVLYKANLKSEDLPNLQKYVNLIKTNYTTEKLDLSQNNFRNPKLVFKNKSFNWDEVYALYVSFVFETEYGDVESKAYHIPGRPPVNVAIPEVVPVQVLENSNANSHTSFTYFTGFNSPGKEILDIDSDARVFHTIDTARNPNAITNMGYWENRNEFYSNEDKWNSSNIGGEDLRGKPVRHHKFPEESLTESTQGNTVNETTLLGVELDIVALRNSLPIEIRNRIKNVKLYYAKRTLENRTVLGQSISYGGNYWYQTTGLSNPTSTDLIGENWYQQIGNLNLINIPRQVDRVDASSYANFVPSQYVYDNGTYPMPTSSFNFFTSEIQNKFGNKTLLKMKPFDLVSQNVSVASATHIKNLYRIKSRYSLITEAPQFKKTFDDDTSILQSGSLNLYFGSDKNYNGIDRPNNLTSNSDPFIFNSIRRIVASRYYNNNSGNIDQDVNINNSGLSRAYNNAGGEKSIILELNSQLYPSLNKDDTLTVSCASQSTINFFINDVPPIGVYLTNICSHKINIYSNFDTQELCYVGEGFSLQNNTFSTFGGDTFNNYYGERATAYYRGLTRYDVNAFNTGDFSQLGFTEFKSIHYYICQSTSNINYRHNGTNTEDTYYPKSDALSIINIPYFIDNSYLYNTAYSSVNDILQPLIETNLVTPTVNYFPNRVIASAKLNPELREDNYLIWEAGNETDVGINNGPIYDINAFGNRLMIQTERSIYATLGKQVLKTDTAEAFIGDGNIFQSDPDELVTSDGIYGGTQSKFNTAISEFGFFFVDRLAGRVFNFTDKLNEISKYGKEIFFRDDLEFKFPNEVNRYVYDNTPPFTQSSPVGSKVTFNGDIYIVKSEGGGTTLEKLDWKFKNTQSLLDIQSCGIECAFDYYHRRLILSRKDFEFNLELGADYKGIVTEEDFPNLVEGDIFYYNGEFYKAEILAPLLITEDGIFSPRNVLFLNAPSLYGVRIDINQGQFVSRPKVYTISYYPEVEGWVSYYDYIPKRLKSTPHNFYSFDNQLYTHNSPNGYLMQYNSQLKTFVVDSVNPYSEVSRLSSVLYKTQAYDRSSTSFPTVDESLKYLTTFDNHQVYDSYQASLISPLINTKTTRNSEGYWITNNFRDYRVDYNSSFLTQDEKFLSFNSVTNISSNKHWSLLKKFNDYWFVNRFTYSGKFIPSSSIILIGNTDNVIFTDVNYKQGDILRINNSVFKIKGYFNINNILQWKIEYLSGPRLLLTSTSTTYTNVEKLSNVGLEVYNIDCLTFKTLR
jgi:hypothetical protein